MGIVDHSSLVLIHAPTLLSMPPEQYDCFRAYNFAFQFLPNTQWKNYKTGAWNQKIMQSFVCALEGRRKRWTERKQKSIVLLWSAAKPPCLRLLLVPQGVCFSSYEKRKRKICIGKWGGEEYLFFKVILFSPNLATCVRQKWRPEIDSFKILSVKEFHM